MPELWPAFQSWQALEKHRPQTVWVDYQCHDEHKLSIENAGARDGAKQGRGDEFSPLEESLRRNNTRRMKKFSGEIGHIAAMLREFPGKKEV